MTKSIIVAVGACALVAVAIVLVLPAEQKPAQADRQRPYPRNPETQVGEEPAASPTVTPEVVPIDIGGTVEEDVLAEKEKMMLALMNGNVGAAAEALSALKPQEQARLLLRSFKSAGSPALRAGIIKMGAILGHPELIELFSAGLDDQDAAVRGATIRAWVATGLTDEKVGDKIRTILGSESSSSVVSAAMDFFWQRPEEARKAGPELLRAIEDSREQIAWKAVMTLSAADVNGPGLTERMKGLYANFAASKEPSRRATAAAAAGYLARRGEGAFRDAVAAYLGDPDDEVRAGAVMGAAAFRDDAGISTAVLSAVEQASSASFFEALSRVGSEIKSPQLVDGCRRKLASVPVEEFAKARTRLTIATAIAAMGHRKEGCNIIYEQMNKSYLNVVFKRVACTELGRTSGQTFAYDPFNADAGSAQWRSYLDAMSE